MSLVHICDICGRTIGSDEETAIIKYKGEELEVCSDCIKLMLGVRKLKLPELKRLGKGLSEMVKGKRHE